MHARRPVCLAFAAQCAATGTALAADAADLARQLSNPVSSLISVPLQFNHDDHMAPTKDGHRVLLNVQPVVPITLDADWNVISRTILPIVSQDHVSAPDQRETGIGDITQSLFLSPKKPTAGGLIWGAGPVFLLPTGSEPELSARKWGAGPTAVMLKQDGHWTYGALVNHLWGFGGSSSRRDVSSTFVQPFLSYATPTAWSFTVNTEATYDWKAEAWSVPVNFTAAKVVKVGDQLMQFGGGLKYWADSPEAGPRDVGVRVAVTFLFPK